MAQEQLFASFVLDKEQGLEIALRAENVAEATPVTGTIRQLPASQDFVEGIMHLREEAIPIINLKKRLGLTQQGYGEDAMVAVINLSHRRYGLLFDEIKEVFAADGTEVQPLDSVLQTDDKIISALIQVKKTSRTVELLDLNNLFFGCPAEQDMIGEPLQGEASDTKESKYFRYVIFNYSGQFFGVPVECTREITFFDETTNIYKDNLEACQFHSGSLDDIFKHGDIDGTLSLRGRTIPVLKAKRILGDRNLTGDDHFDEKTRILVLAYNKCSVGVIVDEVTTIETIAEDKILSMESCRNLAVSGVYQKDKTHNVMLLDMAGLVCDRMDELQAMGRLASEVARDDTDEDSARNKSHHILTENCYLIFTAGRRMAIQLKDVQEIIEKKGIMAIPGGKGLSKDIINLRGVVVPVVHLKEFYGYDKMTRNLQEQKLIICHVDSQMIAFEVEDIVTIYKQEQSQKTTSVSTESTERGDTLDRLIVFDGGIGKKEHISVVNINNLVKNHLHGVMT